jgi:hypothetical protein
MKQLLSAEQEVQLIRACERKCLENTSWQEVSRSQGYSRLAHLQEEINMFKQKNFRPEYTHATPLSFNSTTKSSYAAAVGKQFHTDVSKSDSSNSTISQEPKTSKPLDDAFQIRVLQEIKSLRDMIVELKGEIQELKSKSSSSPSVKQDIQKEKVISPPVKHPAKSRKTASHNVHCKDAEISDLTEPISQLDHTKRVSSVLPDMSSEIPTKPSSDVEDESECSTDTSPVIQQQLSGKNRHPTHSRGEEYKPNPRAQGLNGKQDTLKEKVISPTIKHPPKRWKAVGRDMYDEEIDLSAYADI